MCRDFRLLRNAAATNQLRLLHFIQKSGALLAGKASSSKAFGVQLKKRILPFAFAGALGFLVDAGLLMAFAPLLGAFGGRLLSFCAAVGTTWTINRNFAFADKAATTGKRREFLRYFLAMLPGATVNWLAYGLAIAVLPDTALRLALAVALGSIAGLATNLLAADRLVFRTPS